MLKYFSSASNNDWKALDDGLQAETALQITNYLMLGAGLNQTF